MSTVIRFEVHKKNPIKSIKKIRYLKKIKKNKHFEDVQCLENRDSLHTC